MGSFSLFSKRIDIADFTAGCLMAVSALFVLTFAWQASAGAGGSEEPFLEQLREESRKKVHKEREQIRALLDLEAEEAGDLGDLAGRDAARLAGNSQFHLLLARSYRSEGGTGAALGEYRRALEINLDYSDRHSEFYLGEHLRPLLQEAKALYLTAGSTRGAGEGDREAVRDLFFIERSLAGGCH